MVYTSSTMAKVARWVVLGTLFLIPFLPLYVAEEAFFPFITGKNFLFRILIEIAVAGWLLLALLDKQYRPRFSWTLLLYALLAFWMFVADLFAVNPHKAFWSNFERMDGWVTLIHLFGFFLVAGSMLAAEKIRITWWRAFIAGVALTCGVGLLQIMGVLNINQGALRVDATFGNAIYFAVYLMFALGVTLWQAFASRGWIRWLLLALATIELVMLLLTGSRGPIIATFAAAGFATLWALWKAGKGARKAAVASLVGLIVVIGGFFLIRDTSFVQGQPVIARVATVFSVGEELETRLTIWSMALKGVAERPVTGWGQEGFSHVFNKYYEPSLYAQEAWFDRAHNTYLDWLIAGGIPAFLLFLALLASAVIALMRMPLASGERLMLLSLLVAYGIQALVVFDNLFAYVPLVMILVTAHAISSRPIPQVESLPVMSERQLGVVALPAVTAITVAIIWIVNVPNMTAAHDLIRAQQPTSSGPAQNLELYKQTLAHGSFASQEIREQLAAFSVRVAQEASISNELKEQFLRLAVSEMELEIKRSPNDARLLVEYAAIYRAAGDYENTLRLIDAAIAVSPKKQGLHLERAATLWTAGQQEAARTSFRAAYELDTSFKEPLVYLAASEVLSGRIVEARAFLLSEFGTTTIDSDVLWNAYANAEQYEDLLALQRLRILNTNDDPTQRLLLAKILAVAGRTAEARAEIAATIAAHPEAAKDGAALLAQIAGQQ